MAMQLPQDVDPSTLTLGQRMTFGLLMPGALNLAIMDYKLRMAAASAKKETETKLETGTARITDTIEFVKAQGGGGPDIVAVRYIANLAADAVKTAVGEVGLDLEDKLYEDIRHLVMESINLGDATMAQQNSMWKQQMAILSANVEAHMNRVLSPEANPMMALFQQFMPMMAAMMNNSNQATPQTVLAAQQQPTVLPITSAPSAPTPVSLKDLAQKTKTTKNSKKEANS